MGAIAPSFSFYSDEDEPEPDYYPYEDEPEPDYDEYEIYPDSDEDYIEQEYINDEICVREEVNLSPSFEEVFNRLIPDKDEDQNLNIAKELVKKYIINLREDEALEYLIKLTKKLELSREYKTIVKKFYANEIMAQVKNEKGIDEIVPPEMLKNAQFTALEILQNGNPIEFINGVVVQYHMGDYWTEEGLCVSIASQSCLNSSGIQIAVNGESGSGKSHLVKIHLMLVPSKYTVKSSLSPKAAYYMSLPAGTIVFSDDVNMSIEMEEIIKRATTNYQEYTEYNTVYNGTGKKLVIPPRINWYLTSVNAEASKEVLNRQLTFSTVEDHEHKESIFTNQQDCGVKGIYEFTEITEDILVCRAIYENIKSKTFKVKIPFAKQIDIKDKSDSRVFPLFLDMIKGYTVFFYMQRQTDTDGFLLANKEDFDKAKALFNSQLKNVVSKLNDKEIKIMEYIFHNLECDISEIASGTGMPYATVRSIIKGRKDRDNTGLLSKVEGLEVNRRSILEENINKHSERYYIANNSKWQLCTDFIIWNDLPTIT